MEKEHEEKERKPYQKPKLTRYPLRAEEAVLGFCKSGVGSGSFQARCTIPSSCTAPGS